MKVVLVFPPGDTSLVSPPLGLAYIAAVIRDLHDVVIIDSIINGLSHQEVAGRVIALKPDVVGISAVTPHIGSAMKLASLIKEANPRIKVVAGGPHPTLLAEETLSRCSSIDFVVRGEGEFTFKLLLDEFAKGKPDFKHMGNLTWRDGGRIVNNPSTPYIDDLNKLPFPARDLLRIEEYYGRFISLRKRVTTMITSRGCPFNCVYCSKPIFGRRFRSMSPARVVKEIELLKRDYGIQEIVFYDDSFTLDRDRIKELCGLIIDRKLDVVWKCETRVNLVDTELLALMRRAGCYLIGYGIESGDDHILKTLKKGVTTAQIRDTVRITRKAGIKVLGYFMVGAPDDTRETIEKTISFAKSIGIDYAQFSVATAFPETELFQIAKKLDKIPSDWSKSFYAAGAIPAISLCGLSPEELGCYVRRAYRQFYMRPSYIIRKVASLRSFGDVVYAFRGFLALLKIRG